jgi:hypothetical protein
VRQHCAGGDPLSLAQDSDVLKIKSALGLQDVKIVFKGCMPGRFSTAQRGPTAAMRSYVITYPVPEHGPAIGYLAPIAHELSHVLQIEIAGTLESLQQSQTSKRIELGADFLSGILYKQALGEGKVNDFQHNLELIGLYYERNAEAHGTPEQRITAFRRGIYFQFDEVNRQIHQAVEEFQRNVYGEIVLF